MISTSQTMKRKYLIFNVEQEVLRRGQLPCAVNGARGLVRRRGKLVGGEASAERLGEWGAQRRVARQRTIQLGNVRRELCVGLAFCPFGDDGPGGGQELLLVAKTKQLSCLILAAGGFRHPLKKLGGSSSLLLSTKLREGTRQSAYLAPGSKYRFAASSLPLIMLVAKTVCVPRVSCT